MPGRPLVGDESHGTGPGEHVKDLLLHVRRRVQERVRIGNLADDPDSSEPRPEFVLSFPPRIATGDPGPMPEVWAPSADVTTMHPIGEREVGWE